MAGRRKNDFSGLDDDLPKGKVQAGLKFLQGPQRRGVVYGLNRTLTPTGHGKVGLKQLLNSPAQAGSAASPAPASKPHAKKNSRNGSPAPSHRAPERHAVSTGRQSSPSTSDPRNASTAAEEDDVPPEACEDQEMADGRRAQVAASTWGEKKIALNKPYQPSRLARCSFGPHRNTPEANRGDGEAPAAKASSMNEPTEGTPPPKKQKIVVKIKVNGKVIDKKAKKERAERYAIARARYVKLVEAWPTIDLRGTKQSQHAPSDWEETISMWTEQNPLLPKPQLLKKKKKEEEEENPFLPQADLVAMPSIMGGSVPQAPPADGPTTNAQNAGPEDMDMDNDNAGILTWGTKGKRESKSRSRESTPELSQPHQPRKAADQNMQQLQAGTAKRSKNATAEPGKMRAAEPAKSALAAAGERRQPLMIKLKVPRSREASPAVATPSPTSAKAMQEAAGPSGEELVSPAVPVAAAQPCSEPAADLRGPSGTGAVAGNDNSALKVSVAGGKPCSEMAKTSITQPFAPTAEAKASTSDPARASHSGAKGSSEDAQACQAQIAPAAQVAEAAEAHRHSLVIAELTKRQEEKDACQKAEVGSKAEAGPVLPGQTSVAAMELDERENAVEFGVVLDAKLQDGKPGAREAEPIEAGELTGVADKDEGEISRSSSSSSSSSGSSSSSASDSDSDTSSGGSRLRLKRSRGREGRDRAGTRETESRRSRERSEYYRTRSRERSWDRERSRHRSRSATRTAEYYRSGRYEAYHQGRRSEYDRERRRYDSHERDVGSDRRRDYRGRSDHDRDYRWDDREREYKQSREREDEYDKRRAGSQRREGSRRPDNLQRERTAERNERRSSRARDLPDSRGGSREKEGSELRESRKAASELDKKDGEGESAKTVFTGSTPSTPEEASKPAPPLPSERIITAPSAPYVDRARQPAHAQEPAGPSSQAATDSAGPSAAAAEPVFPPLPPPEAAGMSFFGAWKMLQGLAESITEESYAKLHSEGRDLKHMVDEPLKKIMKAGGKPGLEHVVTYVQACLKWIQAAAVAEEESSRTGEGHMQGVVDRLYIPTKSMLDQQQRLIEGCECAKDAKDLLTLLIMRLRAVINVKILSLERSRLRQDYNMIINPEAKRVGEANGESFERPSPTDSNASNSTGEALQASPALPAPAAAKAKQHLPQSSRAKAQPALGVRDKGVSKVKPEARRSPYSGSPYRGSTPTAKAGASAGAKPASKFGVAKAGRETAGSIKEQAAKGRIEKRAVVPAAADNSGAWDPDPLIIPGQAVKGARHLWGSAIRTCEALSLLQKSGKASTPQQSVNASQPQQSATVSQAQKNEAVDITNLLQSSNPMVQEAAAQLAFLGMEAFAADVRPVVALGKNILQAITALHDYGSGI